MSYSVTIRIYCDHSEPNLCEEVWSSTWRTGGGTKTTALYHAESQGWMVSAGGNATYCPKHAPLHRKGPACGVWYELLVPSDWEPGSMDHEQHVCQRTKGHEGEHRGRRA